ncbi:MULTISPECIES: hypothetical protein [unclassified Staphylococcus]|uniref:hypothetical protein n=1 Tax=unclassified Staphylococcus TaxID=91994 RepID=UPI0021D208A4|nr:MULTISPECIES: hypothetical protein [unclassified Staphylococcus]UXR78130.1 hypothetical protein MUA92_09920 [Staphylococcus sp. IVB6227]UXR82294.1 hypothetical protein MUA51_09635 [Staphylococcus sp. IVB6214]
MRKLIDKLMASDASCYDIYQHTGVNQGIINDLRSGYRSIDDMSFRDVERLSKYAEALHL